MALKWIILLCGFIIWLVILLVMGFLSLIYKSQHTPFIAKRKEYYHSWNEIKTEINLDSIFSNPLKVKFELPDGEKIYYLDVENAVYLYSKRTQEYKTLLKFEGKNPTIYENYFDDLDIISLRSGYKLAKLKIKEPVYTGQIYATNFRVIINDTETKKSHQILMSKIKKAYIAMIKDGKTYNEGYVIQTDQEVYEIVSDNPAIVLIINELIRREKQKNERK